MSDELQHSEAVLDVLSKSSTRKTARRNFLTQAGIAGIGALSAGTLLSQGPAAHATHNNPRIDTFLNGTVRINDFDILNFALNLEYLEAEYYLRAAFNRGLNDADVTGIGNLGPVSGGSLVPFATQTIREYAQEIASDEEAHVKTLRAVLGSRRVARPAIDLSDSFTTAARAAGVIGPTDTFNPFADENSFLLGAFIFEDVGVTAYKGAAPLIKNRNILEAAAGLLAVEAYHAGEVRTVLYGRGQDAPGLITAAQQISDLRDFLDENGDQDQGLTGNTTGPGSNIVPTDSNGLAYSRTPLQVLKIVYGGRNTAEAAASDYLFFPNGVNGKIR